MAKRKETADSAGQLWPACWICRFIWDNGAQWRPEESIQ